MLPVQLGEQPVVICWCILLPLHLKTLFYLKDFFCITSRTASRLDSSEPNCADAGCRPLCVGISSQVLLANEAEIAAAAERYLALLLKHFKNFLDFRVSGFGCNPSHALAECHKVLLSVACAWRKVTQETYKLVFSGLEMAFHM